MSCPQCQGIVQEFNDRLARRELRRYRRRGPSGTTARLLAALEAEGVRDATFLDVGGGVGVIQHELMEAGAASGTHVDASPAYLATARAEAERRGHASRVRYVEGDFVALAPSVAPADVVTLDRVVCCYPDMPALVDASASHARRLYALIFPREHLLMRIGVVLINAIQRIRRRPFRAYLHGTDRIEAQVRRHGFRPVWVGHSVFWQIHLYKKDADAAPWTSPS